MTRLMFAVAAVGMMLAACFAQETKAENAVLLEFSSAHCPPCQAMRPILAQIERLGTPVRRVDVVSEPHLAARYGIRKTPTMVVLSGGKEVTRLVGTHSFEEIRAALAIDHSGPLTLTDSKPDSQDHMAPGLAAPQTRLAPIGGPPHSAATGNGVTFANLDATAPESVAAMPPVSEPMPSISLADAIERARAATVRLRVHDGHGYGAGTGTIIDTHGDEALVLTCGHLFRETQGTGKIEVDLYVAGEVRTVMGQVIDYDADTRDVALVAIRPGFPVQPVALFGAPQSVRNGQTAFSFGCDRGDDPSRRDTRITGVNKYNQHLGVSNLEISGAPIDGRSGGGLFDEQGRLIGVCNAADYKEDVGIYAGPGSIHWQLDRVGLSRLYQSDPSSGSSLPAPPERIASLPDSPEMLPQGALQLASSPATNLGMSGAAAQNLISPGSSAAQEVIVIVRDPGNPAGTPQVLTLAQPSDELMHLIRQQAHNQ